MAAGPEGLAELFCLFVFNMEMTRGCANVDMIKEAFPEKERRYS